MSGIRVDPQRAGHLVRLAARLGYVAVILIATLTPLELDLNPGHAVTRLGRAFYLSSPRALVDAVQNMALFAGWGALWVVTAPATAKLLRALGAATMSGLAISLSAETLQLFLPERTSSLLDVLTNTGGAFLGALFVVVLVEVSYLIRDHRSYLGMPALDFAGAYLMAALFETLLGGARPEVLQRVQGGPLARLRLILVQFDPSSLRALSLVEFLLFLPAGLFGAAAMAEFGIAHRRAAWYTAASGVVVAVAAELVRASLGMPIEVGTAMMHVLGVAAGGWIAALGLPPFSRQLRGRLRPLVVSLVYTAGIIAWAWRPFALKESSRAIAFQLSAERLIPLSGGAWRSGLTGVGEIGQAFFLFLPLGALLAVWPLKQRGRLGYCLPGLYLVAVVELGQLFIAGRFFDVTDFLVQAAAVAIGWAIMRRARYPQRGELLPPPRPARVIL